MLDSISRNLIEFQLEVQQNKIHLREVFGRMLNNPLSLPWFSIVEVWPLSLSKLL